MIDYLIIGFVKGLGLASCFVFFFWVCSEFLYAGINSFINFLSQGKRMYHHRHFLLLVRNHNQVLRHCDKDQAGKISEFLKTLEK